MGAAGKPRELWERPGHLSGVLEIVSQSCAWRAYLRGEDRLGVLGWRGDREEKDREIRGFLVEFGEVCKTPEMHRGKGDSAGQ